MGNPNRRPNFPFVSPFTRHQLQLKGQQAKAMAETEAQRQEIQANKRGMSTKNISPGPAPPSGNRLKPPKLMARNRFPVRKPTAPTTFDFGHLFSADRVEDDSLKKIRDRIYYFAWSRDRKDHGHCDFITTAAGTRRNVSYVRPVAKNTADGLVMAKQRVGKSYDSLLFVSKAISREFAEYIYGINTLEVVVNITPAPDQTGGLASLLANLQRNPHFRQHTRRITVEVHWPPRSSYPAGQLPEANREALEALVAELNTYGRMESLRLKIFFPGRGVQKFELTYTTSPLYELTFTEWDIHGKYNGRHHHLGDTYVAICDEAYAKYRRAGVRRKKRAERESREAGLSPGGGEKKQQVAVQHEKNNEAIWEGADVGAAERAVVKTPQDAERDGTKEGRKSRRGRGAMSRKGADKRVAGVKKADASKKAMPKQPALGSAPSNDGAAGDASVVDVGPERTTGP